MVYYSYVVQLIIQGVNNSEVISFKCKQYSVIVTVCAALMIQYNGTFPQ